MSQFLFDRDTKHDVVHDDSDCMVPELHSRDSLVHWTQSSPPKPSTQREQTGRMPPGPIVIDHCGCTGFRNERNWSNEGTLARPDMIVRGLLQTPEEEAGLDWDLDTPAELASDPESELIEHLEREFLCKKRRDADDDGRPLAAM